MTRNREVKIKIKFTLEQATKAEMCGQRHVPTALTSGKRPSTHCIGGWVKPKAGLDGRGKSRPNRIRSPDRPTRSELLYRLSYRGPSLKLQPKNIKRSAIWTLMWPRKTKINGPAMTKFLTSIFTFPPAHSAAFHICHFFSLWTDIVFYPIGVQMLETWTTFYLLPWMNYALHCTDIRGELPLAQRHHVEICIYQL
jgi:hypothetical protein